MVADNGSVLYAVVEQTPKSSLNEQVASWTRFSMVQMQLCWLAAAKEQQKWQQVVVTRTS